MANSLYLNGRLALCSKLQIHYLIKPAGDTWSKGAVHCTDLVCRLLVFLLVSLVGSSFYLTSLIPLSALSPFFWCIPILSGEKCLSLSVGPWFHVVINCNILEVLVVISLCPWWIDGKRPLLTGPTVCHWAPEEGGMRRSTTFGDWGVPGVGYWSVHYGRRYGTSFFKWPFCAMHFGYQCSYTAVMQLDLHRQRQWFQWNSAWVYGTTVQSSIKVRGAVHMHKGLSTWIWVQDFGKADCSPPASFIVENSKQKMLLVSPTLWQW